jgi:predicted NBD/HSP70 family sugar kinase
MSQKLNAATAVIGIDIGKNSFHIVGHDHRGAIVLRQKWSTRDAPSSASRRRRRRPSAEECGCVATVPFSFAGRHFVIRACCWRYASL